MTPRFRIPDRLSGVASGLRAGYGRAWGKQIVHFLHIGKTGGTAIKHAIGRHWTTAEYGLVFHNHHYTLMDVPAGDRAVLFLRDPITRFVSGFYSRQRKGQPRYFYPWTRAEAAAFGRFATANQLALALSSDDAPTRAHAEQAMRSIGHIRDGYAKWLRSEAYVLSRRADLFAIGFQETLNADFSRLVSRLRLTTAVALPTDDVAAHRTPSGLDRTLDEVAVENLRNWYEADFRLLALCREMSGSMSTGR